MEESVSSLLLIINPPKKGYINRIIHEQYFQPTVR